MFRSVIGMSVITRVILAIFNSVKGICASMCKLQQLDSFNSGSFLVFLYIFNGENDREPQVMTVSKWHV